MRGATRRRATAQAVDPASALPREARVNNDNMIDTDEYRINSLSRAAARAELEGKAIQNAFQTHPVMKYVLTLPVESPLYPANRYLVETLDDSGQEITTIIDTSNTSIIPRKGTPIGNLITWSMPAHDQERPRRKGCGVIRSKDGSAVYTACENDHEHHLKAKIKHCWSRHCPVCCNDTCIRDGVEVEKRFLAYKAIMSKKGTDIGHVSHFVVSPPQDLIKHCMQTYEEFTDFAHYVEQQLTAFGSIGGYLVFHPWRQKKDRWQFAPHFHTLLYGFIDTKGFLRQNPGWIIKKVHAKERIRSIHLTVGYLLTHAGLPIVERDASDVNWELYILNHFDPGILSKGAKFTDDDYNDLGEGRGRMVGDLSDMDWVEFTKDRLSMVPRLRYWGVLSENKMCRIDNVRQYKIRRCSECLGLYRVYQGTSDSIGAYSRYIQDNPVMCLSDDAARVKAFIASYKSRLRSDPDTTLADLVKLIPDAVCSLEYLPQNNDLIMPGPFTEPDTFFLKRQARALGLGDAQQSA